MPLKNVLITGGAGFIGVNLVEQLLKSPKYNLSVLDDLSTGDLLLLKKIIMKSGKETEDSFSKNSDKVWFLEGDIQDQEKVNNALNKQDIVVHLAAQTGIIPSLDDPFQDAGINILGTLNLLKYSLKHGVKKFILASSAASIGAHEPPIDETKLPKPLAPYGASKLAAEAYCSAFNGSFGLNTVVLRFSNIYGPYSRHKESVIARFQRQLIDGEKIIIYGDGDQTRDYLFSRDLVVFIEKVLECKYIGGEVIQLGTGHETSINDLVRIIKKVSGLSPEIIFKSERRGEIKRNYTSICKAVRLLEFEPKTNLLDGISDTYRWFKHEK